jgi:hypothetical protein
LSLLQQSFALLARRQESRLVSKLSGFVGKALFERFGFSKTATLLHCAAPSRLEKWRERDWRSLTNSGHETV